MLIKQCYEFDWVPQVCEAGGYTLSRLQREIREVSCASAFLANSETCKSLFALFYTWSSLTIVPSDLLNFAFKYKETFGQSVK